MTSPAVIHSSAGLLHAQGNYFATSDGQAVYLAGNHTWTSGNSYTGTGPLDFGAYLSLLEGENANLIRYWTWNETVGRHDGAGQVTSPLPFLRSGVPGAGDGGNKLDLSRFNQAYFDKLLTDVQAAANKGMYVSVMLFFDADPVGAYHTWQTDYWNGANNVNGTTTSNLQVEQGTNARTLALQEAYVAKVLDTLHGQSNVLYEVANEPYNDIQTVSWENTIVNFVHLYEQSHGYMKHPVGVTANYPNGPTGQTTANISATDADWISPTFVGFQANPPAAIGKKVVIVDTDHVFGIGGDVSWVWQQFTRGYNVAVMDDLSGTGVSGTLKLSLTASQIAQETSARMGIKETRDVSKMVDMNGMKPVNSLASTGFALANPSDGQYVVYSPNPGKVTVNLSGAVGKLLDARWMDVASGKLSATSTVAGGSSNQTFTDPYSKGVLILTEHVGANPWPPSTQTPPLPAPTQSSAGDLTPTAPAGNHPDLTATFDPVTHKVNITGKFVNTSPVYLYASTEGRPTGPGTGTGFTTIQPNSTGVFLSHVVTNPASTFQVESIEGGVVGRDTLRIGSGAVTFNLHQADVVQDMLSGFRIGTDHLHITDAHRVVLSSSADAGLIAGATSDQSGNAVLHLTSNHDVTLSGIRLQSLSTGIFN